MYALRNQDHESKKPIQSSYIHFTVQSKYNIICMYICIISCLKFVYIKKTLSLKKYNISFVTVKKV